MEGNNAAHHRPVRDSGDHPAVPARAARVHVRPDYPLHPRTRRDDDRKGGAYVDHPAADGHAVTTGARPDHPDGAADWPAGRARPAFGRSRIRGDDGVRHQPISATATAAGVRRRLLGCNVVGHAKSHAGRQPGVPNDQHRAGDEPRRGRGAAARVLRGFPECRPLRQRDPEERPGLVGRARGGHLESIVAGDFPRQERPDGGGPQRPHDRDGARGRHAPQHEAGRSSGLRSREVPAPDRGAQSGERVPPHRPGARRTGAQCRRVARPRHGDAGSGHFTAPPGDGDPQEVLRADCLLRVYDPRPGAGRQQSQGRQARRLCARHRRHLRLLRRDVHRRGAHEGLLDPSMAGDVDPQRPARRRRRNAAHLARPLCRSADPHSPPRLGWAPGQARCG